MKNKILYILFLIGSILLVSFRGGSVSYLFFYFALLLPVLALAYSLYVYSRFRIVQEVARVVVKSREVPYRLILANEDPLPFTNITLNFFTDMTNMAETNTRSLCLIPYQKIQVDAKMYCRYRGTYPVGVKSVEVTDFLGVFTITYPLMSQIRLTAKPRIIPLEQLKQSLREEDSKNNLFSNAKLQDLPDYELRSYLPGDPLKRIHWKNSAKACELLVRRQMPEELTEIVLLMDLSPIDGEQDVRLKTEDSVIEVSLSFLHDYCLKKIPVRVVFMLSGIEELMIDERNGFDSFYSRCADLPFTSPWSLEKLWKEYLSSHGPNQSYILVASRRNPLLSETVEDMRMSGMEVLLIHAGELPL